MKVIFDINNPQHVNDFKSLACHKFRAIYSPDWSIVDKRHKIQRNEILRTSNKPDYDKTNPEHVEYFMTHQVRESMQYFNTTSLKWIYKNKNKFEVNWDWKYQERKRKLPPIRDRELKNDTWKYEEMHFSDMKPLDWVVFWKRYE